MYFDPIPVIYWEFQGVLTVHRNPLTIFSFITLKCNVLYKNTNMGELLELFIFYLLV